MGKQLLRYQRSHPRHRRLAPLFRTLDKTPGLPDALGSRLDAILGECMPPKAALALDG